jgi:hypothetical protein
MMLLYAPDDTPKGTEATSSRPKERDERGIACLPADTANKDRLLHFSPGFPFSNSNTEKVWKPAIILVAFSLQSTSL